MLMAWRYCKDPQGNEVLVLPESTTTEEYSHGESSEGSGVSCHFHAGVE